MSYLVLPSHHYASKWSRDHEIRDFDAVTKVGVQYANEKHPKKKEELLLELVRYFHSYLFKYVSMIVSGALPKNGDKINEDAKGLLKMFVPKNVRSSGFGLAKIARNLCLAFKGMETDEIYNVLVNCLIRALAKYDPNYSTKVKDVIAAIDSLATPTSPSFTSKIVTDKVGFQSSRICKMLVRRGHLTVIAKADKPKVRMFRKADWPPSESLFSNGPVGLPYFVSFYFPRYLQQHITQQMRSLEARHTVMQLEHRQPRGSINQTRVNNNGEKRIPSSNGALVDASGRRWMADCSLMNQNLDLSQLSLAWVNDCGDALFQCLEKRERLFLFLHYSKEMQKPAISQAVGINVREYDAFHGQVLEKVRQQARERAS